MRDFCISAEAIHEFSECSNVLRAPPRDWMTYMQSTAEETIKTKFCKLLDVTPPKDWGGEDSDLMCSVHVGSLELSAAILLKGPAGGKRFNPMKANHLGKNGDQICRPAGTGAQLLIVQHCHEITTPVVQTLRAFALSLPYPKMYCVIDGRTTYRILKGYSLL